MCVTVASIDLHVISVSLWGSRDTCIFAGSSGKWWPGRDSVWPVFRLGGPFALESTSKRFPNSKNLAQEWVCLCACVCVCVDVYESVCKELKGLRWSFHTPRREGWICFLPGPSNPWPHPRDQRVAPPRWIHSFKLPLYRPEVLWTSDLQYSSPFPLTHLFLSFSSSISVPPLLSLRGRLFMWENSQGAG